MKKKIIFLILTIFLVTKVNALEVSVNLNCEKETLKPGDSTNCTITGNTAGQVSGVDMKLRVTNNLEILDLVKSASWEMGDVENNHIALFTSENKSDSFDIATFKIKAKDVTEDSTESVSLINVSLSDNDFEEEEKTVEPLEIKIKLNGEETDSTETDDNKTSEKDEEEKKLDEKSPATGIGTKYSMPFIVIAMFGIAYLIFKKHSKFPKIK